MKDRLVLVVADDERLVEVMRDRLEEEDYRVEAASDGDAAIERAQASCPSVILIDTFLWSDDSKAVCRRLRANPATASIPLVSLFGLHDDAYAAMPVDGRLARPFNDREWYATLERWAGRGTLTTEAQRRRRRKRGTEEDRETPDFPSGECVTARRAWTSYESV